MLFAMALTDGSYVARKRLNNLSAVYQPGSVVPGSAFSDEKEIVQYIRRGWIDVDSVGGSGGGASAPDFMEFETDYSDTQVVTSAGTVELDIPLTEYQNFGDSFSLDTDAPSRIRVDATKSFLVHLQAGVASAPANICLLHVQCSLWVSPTETDRFGPNPPTFNGETGLIQLPTVSWTRQSQTVMIHGDPEAEGEYRWMAFHLGSVGIANLTIDSLYGKMITI